MSSKADGISAYVSDLKTRVYSESEEEYIDGSGDIYGLSSGEFVKKDSVMRVSQVSALLPFDPYSCGWVLTLSSATNYNSNQNAPYRAVVRGKLMAVASDVITFYGVLDSTNIGTYQPWVQYYLFSVQFGRSSSGMTAYDLHDGKILSGMNNLGEAIKLYYQDAWGFGTDNKPSDSSILINGIGFEYAYLSAIPPMQAEAAADPAVLSGPYRYPLVNAYMSDAGSGALSCQVIDHTITTIPISSSTTPVTIQFPPQQDGARDFILRVEVSSSVAPTVTFQGVDETISYETDDDTWYVLEPGVNIISFTETK